MNLEFLFWFFLIGIIIATLQDLKRREIDFWLCKILLFGGVVYVIFYSILNNSVLHIAYLALALLVLFIFKNVFYYSRIFAGGDANLLFSLSAFFVGMGVLTTMINISIYLLILLLSGAIYGTLALLYIYFRNFKKTNKKLGPKLRKIHYPIILGISIILILLGKLSSFIGIAGILLALYPLLFLFSKTLEEELMVKSKSPSQLQEGDWLARDVKLKNGKTIKYSWDGLSKKDIGLIRKDKRQVMVKNGLPFAPAFLLAHILYWIFKDMIAGMF